MSKAIKRTTPQDTIVDEPGMAERFQRGLQRAFAMKPTHPTPKTKDAPSEQGAYPQGQDGALKSPGKWPPRKVFVDGRRTSLRLETVMWDALDDIARVQKCSIHDLIGQISKNRGSQGGLASAIRVYIVEFYRRNAVLP